MVPPSDLKGLVGVEDVVRDRHAEGAKRSMNLGRNPRMTKRPFTRPASSIPVCSKAKISCIVTVLPSMPVISWKLTTLRLPSTRREMWMMTWMAELI